MKVGSKGQAIGFLIAFEALEQVFTGLHLFTLNSEAFGQSMKF